MFFSSLSIVAVFKSRIDKNLDPGSRINIPEPQRCFLGSCSKIHYTLVQYTVLYLVVHGGGLDPDPDSKKPRF
jgi:hypothetical protein